MRFLLPLWRFMMHTKAVGCLVHSSFLTVVAIFLDSINLYHNILYLKLE